jgi:hypothetical protein
MLYVADHADGGRRRALILDAVLARTVPALSGMQNLVDRRGQSRRWTAYRYGVYVVWMR